MEWLEKYNPTKLGDIIGNKKNVLAVIKWIENYGKNKGNLIISGEHGIGKSCSIDVILNSLNYEIKKIKQTSDIYLLCKSIITHADISLLINHSKKNVAIVIDNFDLITSKIDKGGLLKIIKCNNVNKLKPIIIITNNKHNKFLVEIKKFSDEMKFQNPNANDVSLFIKKITKNEEMNIEYDVENELIDFVGGNIRQLILVLYQLKQIYMDIEITKKLWDDFIKNTVEILDTDFDLFKNANKIIHNYVNIDSSLKKYKLDKVLLPLMVYQNYIKYVGNNICLLDKIINKISEGDLVENNIYNDQNWEVEEVHGIYTCVIPSYEMTKLKEKSIRLDFPSDLNKTSTKKTNKKNIKVTKFNISDFITLNELMGKLMKKYKKNELNKIIDDFNIREDIDTILKLNIEGFKKKKL
jgi:hypothetical protein